MALVPLRQYAMPRFFSQPRHLQELDAAAEEQAAPLPHDDAVRQAAAAGLGAPSPPGPSPGDDLPESELQHLRVLHRLRCVYVCVCGGGGGGGEGAGQCLQERSPHKDGGQPAISPASLPLPLHTNQPHRLLRGVPLLSSLQPRVADPPQEGAAGAAGGGGGGRAATQPVGPAGRWRAAGGGGRAAPPLPSPAARVTQRACSYLLICQMMNSCLATDDAFHVAANQGKDCRFPGNRLKKNQALQVSSGGTRARS
jgi:hypothetical protein